ncbi:MAG: PilZ domain-containing protein [Methylococcales bacterium]|nr:PilZ domain-containing protein [Methylococcales bacterium]MBT7443759.1 PilZ domain-containing protein [Methylococcales bacterium]
MEHRASSRQLLKLSVQVNTQEFSVAGEMKDVCLGGLFVDVGQTKLPKGKCVDLEFKLQQEKLYRLSASIRNGRLDRCAFFY